MAKPSFCICASVCMSACGNDARARAICCRLLFPMGSCSIIISLTMDRFRSVGFRPAASRAFSSVGFCAPSTLTGRMEIWSPVFDFTSKSMGSPTWRWTPASIRAVMLCPSLKPSVTCPLRMSVTVPSNTLPGVSSCPCAGAVRTASLASGSALAPDAELF